jgi:adenine-specific DNA-methyltransferase
VIKYLGSKRTLVPVLSKLAEASGAVTSLDLFTGTTRVAQAFKQLGQLVTATDLASYSLAFAKTWIELDASMQDQKELSEALSHLNSLTGQAGYFTKSFCEDARYFQPKNGQKVDAIRNQIDADYKDSWLFYPLLTSLILAADRVDSTTGIQMAFLKQWSARSNANLVMKDPGLMPGSGTALQGDAITLAPELAPVDLAYLDPPYNQHRYFANYHVWETLVRWDSPDSYGVANKRIDVRDDATKSAFNSKKTMSTSLAKVISDLKCETMILSYNNESWLSRDELFSLVEPKGKVEILDFDFKRYVGAQIGVYNKLGKKVGEPGHSRNIEHIVLAGPKQTVDRMTAAILG